jgi:hypothetical protein
MELKPFLLDMWLDTYEHGIEFKARTDQLLSRNLRRAETLAREQPAGRQIDSIPASDWGGLEQL